jgi:hypothetical protein
MKESNEKRVRWRMERHESRTGQRKDRKKKILLIQML